MTLTNKAYLVIPPSNGDEFPNDEAVFELRGVESTNELQREMLLGNRGQLISQIISVVPFGPELGEDASGLNIDGGGGVDSFTLNVEITTDPNESDPPLWGAGFGAGPPADAQGEDPLTKAQVLKYWSRRARTDSRTPAKLHWGEWTDDRFGPSGAFNSPTNVVVQGVSFQDERDDPSATTATIELVRTSALPDIEADEFGDDFAEFFDDLT